MGYGICRADVGPGTCPGARRWRFRGWVVRHASNVTLGPCVIVSRYHVRPNADGILKNDKEPVNFRKRSIGVLFPIFWDLQNSCACLETSRHFFCQSSTLSSSVVSLCLTRLMAMFLFPVCACCLPRVSDFEKLFLEPIVAGRTTPTTLAVRRPRRFTWLWLIQNITALKDRRCGEASTCH